MLTHEKRKLLVFFGDNFFCPVAWLWYVQTGLCSCTKQLMVWNSVYCMFLWKMTPLYCTIDKLNVFHLKRNCLVLLQNVVLLFQKNNSLVSQSYA